MSHPKDRLVVNLYICTTDRRPLKPKKLSHFYTPDGPTDARIDGWTDRQTTNGQKDIQMDRQIDGRTEERMDRVIPIYPCL
jgi:hypothetical protein